MEHEARRAELTEEEAEAIRERNRLEHENRRMELTEEEYSVERERNRLAHTTLRADQPEIPQALRPIHVDSSSFRHVLNKNDFHLFVVTSITLD